MDFLRQLWNGLREAWQKLTLTARVNIALFAAATVAVIIFVALTGPDPLYVNVVTGRTAEEAGTVMNTLDGAGIPYQRGRQLGTILVPHNRLVEAQEALGAQGIEAGDKRTPAWELFDSSDMMSSNKMLHDIKLVRARQGAMEQLLEKFAFVDKAQVILREAESSFFTDDQEPSSAAVVLSLSRPLTDSEVDLVVSQLVRAGGSFLSREHITVGTDDGRTLWDPGDTGFGLIASDRLRYKASVERNRKMKLQNFFDRQNIPAVFEVSALIDFDRKEEEKILMEKGAEVSSYTRTINNTIQDVLPEGPPGAVANVAEAGGMAGGTSTSETDEEEITNSEPSVTTTRTVTEPGRVVKFLVSASIQGNVEGSEADGDRAYTPLSDEQIADYEEAIAAIVGTGMDPVNPGAPTQVVITSHDFLSEGWGMAAATTAAASARMQERMQAWIWTGAQVLMIILGFLMLRIMLRRVIAAPEPVVEAEEEVADIPEATREDMRRQNVSEEITELAVNNPEVVAALLRSWMSEEDAD